MESEYIVKLLRSLFAHQASDLHLVPRSPPLLRVNGRLKAIDDAKLRAKELRTMCYSLISSKQQKRFKKDLELDFGIDVEGVGRVRANYYHTLGNIGASFRAIPSNIPKLEELALPTFYSKMALHTQGLILITGATGSGKSTTLAAMLNEINNTQHKHIVTIEDPVEFVHKNNKSIFSHRELGRDTKNFSSAIKHALRQDPDVILVGELRDKETIRAALTAAQTGHLVLATLHSSSAVGSIRRIIDAFDGNEQNRISSMLCDSLIAVGSQKLVPKIDGGQIVVPEILINNDAVANLIREGKIHQIYSVMQLGQSSSQMQTQSKILFDLVKRKIINGVDSIRLANKPDELEKMMRQGA